MDQQKRFLLALVLSGAVLITWQTFFAPTPEDVTAAPAKDAASKDAPKDVAKDPATPGQPALAQAQAQAQAHGEAPSPKPARDIPIQTLTMGSSAVTLSLTNDGGRLAGFTIQSPIQYQKAGDLLATFPKDTKHLPLSLDFAKGQVVLPARLVYEVVEAQSVKSPKGDSWEKITLRYAEPGGKFTLDKVFTLDPKQPNLIDLDVRLTNTGSSTLGDQLALDFMGYKDPNDSKSFLDFRPSELESLCHINKSMERTVFDSLDKPKSFKGDVSWAGIGLRYFAYVALFDAKAAPESCAAEKVDKDYVRVRAQWPKFAINPGEVYSAKQQIFMGAKDLDAMEAIRPELAESVDFGFFKLLAAPLHILLKVFYGWVKNWGLAIILLTLLIKIVTWPITDKSYANTERMKEIQPKLDELRSKYENDQQRLAEETMKLFKENKFNPLGGCLPMLLQMPILYGLYVMIINSVELYQAEFFFWYTDLSSRDPYFVLPILMGVVMVVQQKFMMTTAPNEQTKLMMQIMPVIFTAFMLFLPSGLVLYYFLNLVLGVLQQWMIRRKFERRAAERAKAAAAA